MTTHKTAPFDLEKALAGSPVITRNGQRVSELIKTKTGDEANKIVAIINGYVYSFYENGKFYSGVNCENDLFMLVEPVKKSCWVNIYKYGRVEGGFGSKMEADSNYNDYLPKCKNPRVACIQIEYEVNE